MARGSDGSKKGWLESGADTVETGIFGVENMFPRPQTSQTSLLVDCSTHPNLFWKQIPLQSGVIFEKFLEDRNRTGPEPHLVRHQHLDLVIQLQLQLPSKGKQTTLPFFLYVFDIVE